MTLDWRLVVRWLPSLLILAPWLLTPAVPSEAVRVRDLSGAASFRLLDWETEHLAERAQRLWAGLFGSAQVQPDDVRVLQAYFAPGSRREQTRPNAEAALEHLVTSTYEDHGLHRSQPLGTPRLFPPVLVALTAPPNVLVISPRTDLRVVDSVVLQGLDTVAQERLESSADSAGVSSLVAPIGGLATYPSMVLDEDALDRVVASVAHEWLHQYLIFYPLGSGYWSRQETREINETTADLVSQEIAADVGRRYELVQPRQGNQGPPQAGTFDFRAFMRTTRLHVEELLAADRVDEAEAYMRAQRDELQRHGYAIRKLNQAYFALYGSYGGGFAASPASPIPDLLRQLRASSGSLADFVFTVRGITTIDELRFLASTDARQ